VLLLQPAELVDPPPSPTLKALGVIRSIEFGHMRFVLDWLELEPTLIREQCPLTGMTPLLAVITSSSLTESEKASSVRWLLQKGADMGARDWQGRCALQLAYSDVKLMGLLLERGARPRPYYFRTLRKTLLSVAASRGDIDVLRLLLEWHAKSGLFTPAELDEALVGAKEGAAAGLFFQSGKGGRQVRETAATLEAEGRTDGDTKNEGEQGDDDNDGFDRY
jgi:ankyrin repeat protein